MTQDEKRARILARTFKRGSSVPGGLSCTFDRSLEEELQLAEGEIPVISASLLAGGWLVVTSRRILLLGAAQAVSLLPEEIRSVGADLQAEQSRGRYGKRHWRSMKIEVCSGGSLRLEFSAESVDFWGLLSAAMWLVSHPYAPAQGTGGQDDEVLS